MKTPSEQSERHSKKSQSTSNLTVTMKKTNITMSQQLMESECLPIETILQLPQPDSVFLICQICNEELKCSNEDLTKHSQKHSQNNECLQDTQHQSLSVDSENSVDKVTVCSISPDSRSQSVDSNDSGVVLSIPSEYDQQQTVRNKIVARTVFVETTTTLKVEQITNPVSGQHQQQQQYRHQHRRLQQQQQEQQQQQQMLTTRASMMPMSESSSTTSNSHINNINSEFDTQQQPSFKIPQNHYPQPNNSTTNNYGWPYPQTNIPPTVSNVPYTSNMTPNSNHSNSNIMAYDNSILWNSANSPSIPPPAHQQARQSMPSTQLTPAQTNQFNQFYYNHSTVQPQPPYYPNQHHNSVANNSNNSDTAGLTSRNQQQQSLTGYAPVTTTIPPASKRMQPPLSSSSSSSYTMNPTNPSSTPKPQNHRSPEIFPCNLCASTFTTSSLLESHEATYHRINFKRYRCCLYCQKKYTSRCALQNHIIIKHSHQISVTTNPSYPPATVTSISSSDSTGHNQNSSWNMSTAGVTQVHEKRSQSMSSNSGYLRQGNYHCKPCNMYYDHPLIYSEHIMVHSFQKRL